MKNELDTVTIYTDGACAATGTRAGHGGWTAILVFGAFEKVVGGHSFPETSNSMELKALIGGIKQLKRPCRVEFYSDSMYLINGCNKWLKGWKKNGWKTAEHDTIANKDLWQEIDRLKSKYDIHGNWVKGHVIPKHRGVHHEYNSRCDEEAVKHAWLSYREVNGIIENDNLDDEKQEHVLHGKVNGGQ